MLVRRLGMIESITNAVDQLLDREQRNQQTGQRARRIERSDRRARRKAKTPKAPEIIDIAEPDQAKRDAENHEANNDLDDHPWRAVQRLGYRSQIQMIVAAGGHGGADEKRTEKKGGKGSPAATPGRARG